MAMRLYGEKTNKNVLKAIVTSEFVGVDVELVENFAMGVSNKTSEFLKMNPNGKIPMLETPNGSFFESNTITRYVAGSNSEKCNLFGSSTFENRFIEHWISCASSIEAKLLNYIKQELNPNRSILALDPLKYELQKLDKHLESKSHLVGNSVTVADIVMTCNLIPWFRHINLEHLHLKCPHVNNYFQNMVSKPEFKVVLSVLETTKAKDNRERPEDLGVKALRTYKRRKKEEPFQP